MLAARAPHTFTLGVIVVVFNVTDIVQVAGKHCVLTGRVESGRVRRGDKLVLKSPAGELDFTVTDFGPFFHRCEEVSAGDNVALVADCLDLGPVKDGIGRVVDGKLEANVLRAVSPR